MQLDLYKSGHIAVYVRYPLGGVHYTLGGVCSMKYVSLLLGPPSGAKILKIRRALLLMFH